MITGWLPAFTPKGSWVGIDPGGRDTMGVRGARQGPVPHQTRRSHWVGFKSTSCFLGGISSAFGCWGLEWRQWLAPDGVVTADLARHPLLSRTMAWLGFSRLWSGVMFPLAG